MKYVYVPQKSYEAKVRSCSLSESTDAVASVDYCRQVSDAESDPNAGDRGSMMHQHMLKGRDGTAAEELIPSSSNHVSASERFANTSRPACLTNVHLHVIVAVEPVLLEKYLATLQVGRHVPYQPPATDILWRDRRRTCNPNCRRAWNPNFHSMSWQHISAPYIGVDVDKSSEEDLCPFDCGDYSTYMILDDSNDAS